MRSLECDEPDDAIIPEGDLGSVNRNNMWLPLRAKLVNTPSDAVTAVVAVAVYAACAVFIAYVTVVDDALVGGVCVSNYSAATTAGQTEHARQRLRHHLRLGRLSRRVAARLQ